MNSSLVISGYALYVFMFFFVVLIIGLIILGNSYMKEAIKNDKLEGRNRNLVNEYEKLQHDFYRATFKVPEIDVVKNDKRK